MIKQTIKYTNFAEETVTEDWHFHLSKTEAVGLEVGTPGGLEGKMKQIIASKDMTEVLSIFRVILRASVGKRSDDGKRFNKSAEIVDEFTGSGAEDELIFTLLTDEKLAATFIQGLLPKEVAERAATIKPTVELRPVPAERPRMTLAEMQAMSADDLATLARKYPNS